MPPVETPRITQGWQAKDFSLLGIDENYYSLANVKGKKGLVVAFICNHCPYVKSIAKKIARDANDLKKLDIGFIGINSNDYHSYPEDSFENMKKFAVEHQFNFPYVIDSTQEVAKNYEAVCTPDFFGFNNKMELQYRGRLDSSRKDLVDNAKRELFEAMKEIANSGLYLDEQFSSIGCSIKWRS